MLINYDSPSFNLIDIDIHEDKTMEKLNWIKNMVSGGIAGAVSRTITAPLDRLKILYQINYKGLSNPPNIIKGLNQVFIKDGFTGLFRGNFINTMKACPETSIKFSSFEFFKHKLTKDGRTTISKPELFMCGAFSGLLSSFCVFPLEVLKTRFAAAPTGTYNSITDAVTKISKTEGRIKPFFNGYQATLCSVFPNSGINLMTYEILKTKASKYFTEKKNKEIPHTLYMAIGACSAIFSSSLMYPWQLITSRVIMQGLSNNKKSMRDIIKEVKYNEGLIGFYKGFKPAMTKILLGNGIAFYVYEACKIHLI
jgi:solute carrier family 25 phosphate transporter 23/24/25/41